MGNIFNGTEPEDSEMLIEFQFNNSAFNFRRTTSPGNVDLNELENSVKTNFRLIRGHKWVEQNWDKLKFRFQGNGCNIWDDVTLEMYLRQQENKYENPAIRVLVITEDEECYTLFNKQW